MRVEVLLMEREIAQEFIESLEARDLPEKFFYWSPLSVARWMALLDDPAFSGARDAWKHVAEAAPGIIAHMTGPVSVISFGAGSGWSDRLVIAALLRAGREVRYFPVDASQTLLEEACAAAEDDEIETLAVKADVSSPTHLVLSADAAEGNKLFLISGNTLGSFDPVEQIRHVAECLAPGDRLVFDGALYSEQSVAAAGSAAHLAFAFAPLASIGVGEEDGDVRIESRVDERHAGLWLMTRRFKAARDLVINANGRRMELARGERISLNFEYLYTVQALRWIAATRGHLNVLAEITSSEADFAALVCGR